MNTRWKRVFVTCIMVVALVATVGAVGCGDDNGDTKKTTINIGILTDLTGPAAVALVPLTWSLEDGVSELNAGLIPWGPKLPEGVELKVIAYDTALNQAKFIPGYEWLKEKGCPVIISIFNDCSEVLKERAAQDKIPVLGLATSAPMVFPPGWIFAFDCIANWDAQLMMKWITDHWDYAGTGRNPKIATVGYADAWGKENVRGTEDWMEANPGKVDYIGTWLAPVGTNTWSGEVNATLDCDWVQTCANGGAMAATFWKQYKASGGKAMNFDTTSMSAYTGFITDFVGWESLDGKINDQSWGVWTNAGKAGWEPVTYWKQVVEKYHPSDAADLIAAGMGYLGGGLMQVHALHIMAQAILDVGAENFTGQAFYDTAIDFEEIWCGATRGFKGGVRYAVDEMIMLEWVAAEQDMFMISDGWLDVPKHGF